jgi:antitoxin component of MazEF toxin-antitoxin module
MQAAIRRMGNSAGILLSKAVLAHLDVATGYMLEFNFYEGRVVLSPARASEGRLGQCSAGRFARADCGVTSMKPSFVNRRT